MPEASGSEILSDISDFWAWLSSSLPTYLSQNHPGIEPDLERICCTGESAGGYLAVMSALAQAEGVKGGIRALIAAYPMLDVGADFFSKNLGTQHPLGVPMLPAEVLESHLRDMKEGDVVSEVEPPERFQLAVGMVQQGRWMEFLGEGAGLFPMKVIEEVQEVPFMFLFHGSDDSAVPVEGTEKFAEKAKVRFGEEKVLLYTGPGEHGFDGEVGVETPWMEEGLVKVTRAWLGSE
jgi:acetyl esterase/lipase